MVQILMVMLVALPLAGALICYALGRKSDRLLGAFATTVCTLEMLLAAVLLVQVVQSGQSTMLNFSFGGFELGFVLDGFRAMYLCISAFMWLATTVFSPSYLRDYKKKARYWLFTLLTQGFVMGVFLSADLLTCFMFFELMGFASYPLVAQDEKPESLRAARIYLVVAVASGMAMLMGMFILYTQGGTLHFEALRGMFENSQSPEVIMLASALLLVGFGAKAGMFPLHFWLARAHPAAPAPASALLSGILTKTGVFGVMLVSMNIMYGSYDWFYLILALGTVSMILGAVCALFSDNLKRALAFSSISQIGFITVGIAAAGFLGEHNALAVRGVVLHMMNHSLLKLVLFLCAGVVYMNLHKLRLSEICGFGRGKPLLMFAFLVGAAGAGGIPALNGYVSKTLLHESLVECTHIPEIAPVFSVVEPLFLICGGLTVAYMLRLFVVLFIKKNKSADTQQKMDCMNKSYITRPAAAVLLVGGALPLALGIYPRISMNTPAAIMQGIMYGQEPSHDVAYFAWINLRGALISLAVGIVVFVLLRRHLLHSAHPVAKARRKIHRTKGVFGGIKFGLACTVEMFCVAVEFVQILPEKITAFAMGTLLPVIAKFLSELPDIGMRAVCFVLLRPVNPKKFPGRFLGKYCNIISPTAPKEQRPLPKATVTSSFSYVLLLFGLGFCAVLIYMLVYIFA